MPNDMTPEQAVIYEKVYLPAFIEKCAELGEPIEDQDTLDSMLENAALVRVKLAQSTTSTVKRANAALKKAMGLDLHEAAQQRTAQVKSAALGAKQDPAVRQALLA